MDIWLFQANPAVWRIDDYIREHPEALTRTWRWSCWRFRDRVRRGDRALLWIAGAPATRGVHAIGRLTGAPVRDVEDDDYWTDPADRTRARWLIEMRFDTWLLDDPVLAVDLRADPRFAGASILRTPRFANPHPLTSEQWNAIADRLPRRRTRRASPARRGAPAPSRPPRAARTGDGP